MCSTVTETSSTELAVLVLQFLLEHSFVRTATAFRRRALRILLYFSQFAKC